MSSSEDTRINSLIAGKYRIVKRIARGGMGSVYLATHELMNRQVALKLLHEKHQQADEAEVFFKRFLREARAASQIEHPHAVTIYDFGVVDDVPYLAMQYIEGRNLSALLLQDGKFPIGRAYPLFEQVCSALQTAHELTIAHRDIKPDNIIIQQYADGSETAHVLDFGIAKAMQGSATMVGAMTTAGKTVGTPRYMSPEQALGKDVDLRTDVYSLGVVFYEMLVGDIPFSANTPVELMYEHLRTPLKPLPAELCLPKGLQAVVSKALEKKPADRYASPIEFANAIKRVLEGKSSESSSPILPLTQNRLLLVTLGGGLLLTTLVSGFLLSRETPQPHRSPEAETLATKSVEIEEVQEKADSTLSDSSDQSLSAVQGPEEFPIDRQEEAEVLETGNPEAEVPETDLEEVDSTTTEGSIPTAMEPETVELDTDEPDPIATDMVEVDSEIGGEFQKGENQVDNSETTASLISETEELAITPEVSDSEVSTPSNVPPPDSIPATEMSVAELIELLGSEEREPRIEAAIILQNRGDEAVDLLIEALRENPSARVRFLSAFVLGKMQAHRAVPALQAAQDDPESLVAETARRALASLERRR